MARSAAGSKTTGGVAPRRPAPAHDLRAPRLRAREGNRTTRAISACQEAHAMDLSLPRPPDCRGLSSDGTDQRLGVSFDQQDGSALGGWTGYGVTGAYARTA